MTRSESRPVAYVVPHTHWDREWYLPFESFRVRLVDVIDRLLDVMASDPDYQVFTLDGQTIVLDDYLDVQPERSDELRKLIEEKRIRIGPWHVLADEFLVSPEALIRNLATGARVCEAFGDRLGVMYTPDSFGHISQLPLLAHEFGLDAIVFERGVGDEGERLRSEFLWRTADGSAEIFSHHLVTTYSSAAAIGHADWELTDAYDPKRAVQHARAALFGSEGTDLAYLPPWFRASLERVAGGAAEYALGDALLLLNGSDHLDAQPNIPELIRDLNDAIPDVRFEHADLEAFIEHARSSAGALQTHCGEFRGSRYQHVLSGVLSARMYLKQANEAAQNRLEKTTEPLAALAWLHGDRDPRPLLQHAWRTLLENHPHDSICGCSVDAVHDAMMVRFASVHHIASPLERRAFDRALGPSAPGAIDVFHPHPVPARRVVEARVTLPDAPDGELELVDADGRPAPATIQTAQSLAPGESDLHVTDTRVRFVADLPACGFASYRLRENAAGATAATEAAAASPAVTATSDATGASLENATLRLEVDADGAARLRHKPSGSVWPLELRFEDDGDAGDSYDFSPIDEATMTVREPVDAPAVVDADPLRATLRLHYRPTIPRRLSDDRARREGEVELPITMDLSLETHRPSVDVRVTVDNRAEDHRLRLCVATGASVDRVLAEGHFDLVERPVAAPSGDGWFQQPRGSNHQRRFVAAHDGNAGLAVLNRGLPEYEARAGDRGVNLAITLLRCVGWLSRNDLTSRPQGAGPAMPTPGAQCPGRHTFELALLPLVGQEWLAELMREADQVAAPPALRVGSPEAQGHGQRPGGSAAALDRRSLIALSEPLVMTACKLADARDTLLVRIWNPSARRVEGTLSLGLPIAEAHLVRFDETRLDPLDVSESTVRIDVPSQGVRTVELVAAHKGVVASERTG